MRYIQNLSEYTSTAPSVVTLGKFDGLHLGHRLLLAQVRAEAEEKGLCAIVFTFNMPPVARIRHTGKKVLMTNEERKGLLAEEGIDTLIECPFTEEFRSLSPDDFIEKILLKELHVKAIVVGDDFHFGKDRAGDADYLEKVSQAYGFTVKVIGKKKDEQTGREISSTWVREELVKGGMETVGRLLGRPYFVTGTIVRGKQLGRTIDVPTINQEPPAEKILPPYGVYISTVEWNRKAYPAVTNIGTNPTVGGDHVTVETHLLDFSEDLYGAVVRVNLLHFQRPEKTFPSLEAMREQIRLDIEAARRYADQV